MYFYLQEVSKKDRALDAKGGSNTKDIRIENFDVAFADKVKDFKNCSTYMLPFQFYHKLTENYLE